MDSVLKRILNAWYHLIRRGRRLRHFPELSWPASPGPNSMLSFGSAAYTGGKELIGTFSANLETLPGATADPKTAEWWAGQPEAWAASRQELELPQHMHPETLAAGMSTDRVESMRRKFLCNCACHAEVLSAGC